MPGAPIDAGREGSRHERGNSSVTGVFLPECGSGERPAEGDTPEALPTIPPGGAIVCCAAQLVRAGSEPTFSTQLPPAKKDMRTCKSQPSDETGACGVDAACHGAQEDGLSHTSISESFPTGFHFPPGSLQRDSDGVGLKDRFRGDPFVPL